MRTEERGAEQQGMSWMWSGEARTVPGAAEEEEGAEELAGGDLVRRFVPLQTR